MKKVLSVTVIIAGILALLLFAKLFMPNPFAEKKVKEQAAEYIDENFNNNFEVYGVMDNSDFSATMEYFEYAAQVRDKENGVEFLIYSDENTKKMNDTYVTSKWEMEIKKAVTPYVKERFKDAVSINVVVDHERYPNLHADPNTLETESYNKTRVNPLIHIVLEGQVQQDVENRIQNLTDQLKKADILQRGTMSLEYDGSPLITEF